MEKVVDNKIVGCYNKTEFMHGKLCVKSDSLRKIRAIACVVLNKPDIYAAAKSGSETTFAL